MENDSEAGKLMRNSLWAGLQKEEETLDQIVSCFQGEVDWQMVIWSRKMRLYLASG